MIKRNRWLIVVPLLLMLWGLFTYACETMEMPPQPVCCCEDGMAGCDKAAPPPSEEGCEHVGLSALSASCCDVEYQSGFEDAAPASSSADQVLTWSGMVALLYWPHLDALSSLSPVAPPSDPDWLLAQAESGRTVYLSTLRLRI